MTPKEKAKELVDTYMFMEVPYYVSKFEIKLCAIIAVDLVIEVEKNIFKGKVHKSYWEEVKKEIEKL